MHTLKKKIDDKFCKIDKLVGIYGGFKMESRFKNEIKDLKLISEYISLIF